ncbi:MAG: M56 family metallopeptidase [Myxococcota bacterium]
MLEPLQSLDVLGQGLVSWLLTITVWTGALLLVARALDHALRRHVSAAWRLPLYGLVFVRLLLPLQWESPLSPLTAFTEPASASAMITTSATAAATPELIELSTPALIGTSATTTPVAASSVSTPSSPTPLPWGLLVLLAWLGGTAVLLVRLARDRVRLHELTADSRPATSADLRGAEPRARVLVHETAGPLAFGWRQPTIVLPRALIDSDASTLHCVLAHERAHLQRRDPAVATGLTVLVALAWPVLPVWLAARRARTLLELAADERAVARFDGRWREYGRIMVELAAGARPGPRAALGLFGHVRERIGALRHRTRLGSIAQATVGLGMPTVVLACAGVPSQPEEPTAVARCEADADALASIPVTDSERHAVALHRLADHFEQAQLEGDPGATCHDATRDALLEAATQWHHQSYETGTDRLRALSADAYARFAALFPEDDDTHSVQYFHGELLWARAVHAQEHAPEQVDELYLRSQRLFDASIDRDPEGEFASEAAYAQVMAARNAHKPDALKPSASGDARSDFPAHPYGPEAEQLLASYRRYFDHADADDPRRGEVAYFWGQLAMQHNQFTDARTPLDMAITSLDERPEVPDIAVRAAEMKLDLLTIAWVRDESAANELADYTAQLPQLALWQHESATKLHDAVPPLEFGIAWKAAAAGNGRACGEAYEQLAARYPEHERHDDALTNAARCFDSAGDHERARAIRARQGR